MDYEQFRSEVKEHIKEFLPEKFKDSNVDINKIEKNRSSLYGLTVHQPDINISPTVYLDTFYERMKDGVPLGNVMEDIAATIEKHSLDKDFNVINGEDAGYKEEFQSVIDKEKDLISEMMKYAGDMWELKY